jgi:hypothetical protein
LHSQFGGAFTINATAVFDYPTIGGLAEYLVDQLPDADSPPAEAQLVTAEDSPAEAQSATPEDSPAEAQSATPEDSPAEAQSVTAEEEGAADTPQGAAD